MRAVLIGTIRVALVGALIAMPVGAAGQSVFPLGPRLIGPGSTIGVSVVEVTDATADNAAGGAATGVRVDRVQEGSPAARAGFEVGDVVVEFDGERVRGTRQFSRIVQETPPNRAVTATVVRNGARRTLTVTPEVGRADVSPVDVLPRVPERGLQLRPFAIPEGRGTLVQPFRSGTARLGVTAIAVEGQLAEHYGVSGGVLVMSVDADSPAARAGIRAGDVITRVGSRAIRGPSELVEAVGAAGPGGMLDLRLRRDGKEVTAQVTMPQPSPSPSPATGDRFRI